MLHRFPDEPEIIDRDLPLEEQSDDKEKKRKEEERRKRDVVTGKIILDKMKEKERKDKEDDPMDKKKINKTRKQKGGKL